MIDAKERIRNIVEGVRVRICPICGYTNFKNSIHPYAGNRYKTKAKTKWCTGTTIVFGKEYEPFKSSDFRCPKCLKFYRLTIEEFDFFSEIGQCGSCYEKSEST